MIEMINIDVFYKLNFLFKNNYNINKINFFLDDCSKKLWLLIIEYKNVNKQLIDSITNRINVVNNYFENEDYVPRLNDFYLSNIDVKSLIEIQKIFNYLKVIKSKILDNKTELNKFINKIIITN